MIPLRRSPVFAIRNPRLRARHYASQNRWPSSGAGAGAQMAYKTLPTLSLQGKVSNDDIIIRPSNICEDRFVL